MTDQPEGRIDTTEVEESALEDVAGGGPGGNAVVTQKGTGSSKSLD